MEPAAHLARLVDVLRDDTEWRYHAAVRHEARELIVRMRELAGGGRPGLDDVRRAAEVVAEALLTHLDKEEHIVFPALAALAEAARSGAGRPPLPFPTLLHPIRVMETEHDRLQVALADLRLLVGRARVPEPMAGEWSDWRRALDRLAEGVSAHARLENDVLYPRAIELECSIA